MEQIGVAVDSKVEFLTDGEVWEAVQRLANRARRGRVHAAIAFVTEDLLALEKGDRLLVNLDKGTLRSGATNPEVLMRMVRRGVEVFSSPNLHAKVVVVSRAAIIGSANMSQASRDRLREAAVIVRGHEPVREARRLIDVLGEPAFPVDLAFLKQAQKDYRPPRRGSATDPAQPHPHAPPSPADRMWIIPLDYEDWTATASKIHERELRRVRRGVGPRTSFELDYFHLDESEDPGVETGDVVIQICEEGHELCAWPPSRVVAKAPVPRRGQGEPGVIVYLARPVGGTLALFDELKDASKKLGARLSDKDTRKVTKRSHREAILRLWPDHHHDG